jgi:hypothetical protein
VPPCSNPPLFGRDAYASLLPKVPASPREVVEPTLGNAGIPTQDVRTLPGSDDSCGLQPRNQQLVFFYEFVKFECKIAFTSQYYSAQVKSEEYVPLVHMPTELRVTTLHYPASQKMRHMLFVHTLGLCGPFAMDS